MIWQILGLALEGILFLTATVLVLGLSFVGGYLLLFLPLVYIGTHLSTIPLERKRKVLRWRGRKITKVSDEEMEVAGAVVWIPIALSVLVGILAIIGYLARIAGVSFV